MEIYLIIKKYAPEAEYSASVDDGHLDTKRPLRGASERKKDRAKMPGSFFEKWTVSSA